MLKNRLKKATKRSLQANNQMLTKVGSRWKGVESKDAHGKIHANIWMTIPMRLESNGRKGFVAASFVHDDEGWKLIGWRMNRRRWNAANYAIANHNNTVRPEMALPMYKKRNGVYP